jgi:hypothetical protein
MAKISRNIGNADLLAVDVRIHSQNATKGPEFTFRVHTAVCLHQKMCLNQALSHPPSIPITISCGPHVPVVRTTTTLRGTDSHGPSAAHSTDYCHSLLHSAFTLTIRPITCRITNNKIPTAPNPRHTLYPETSFGRSRSRKISPFGPWSE